LAAANNPAADAPSTTRLRVTCCSIMRSSLEQGTDNLPASSTPARRSHIEVPPVGGRTLKQPTSGQVQADLWRL
jgi:hypothetical protein